MSIKFGQVATAATNVVLATCAIVLTITVVQQRRDARAAVARRQAPALSITKLANTVNPGNPELVVGPSTATAELVVFTDYQCPFCKRLETQLDSIRKRDPNIRVAYRAFPLESIHPYAKAAAIAATCAARQNRFEALHRELFAHQDSLGSTPYTVLAQRAGIPDTAAFGKCLRSPDAAALVQRDIDEATRLKFTGTPMVINRRELVGGAPGIPLLDTLLSHARRTTGAN